MEKKTVMLTNFKKIQEDLNNLAQEYKIAKDNNDEKKLNNCTKQYEELKTLLRSNAYYFNNLNVTEINNKLEVIDNEEEIGHLKAKKAEKNVY